MSSSKRARVHGALIEEVEKTDGGAAIGGLGSRVGALFSLLAGGIDLSGQWQCGLAVVIVAV